MATLLFGKPVLCASALREYNIPPTSGDAAKTEYEIPEDTNVFSKLLR